MINQMALMQEPKKFPPKKNKKSNHPLKIQPSVGEVVVPRSHLRVREQTGIQLVPRLMENTVGAV